MSNLQLPSIDLTESRSENKELETKKLFKAIDDYDFSQFRRVYVLGNVNINVRNKQGSTLLMHMIRQTEKEEKDYSNFITFVIMRGINVNKGNKYGYTPLMHACMKGMYDMVELICSTSFEYACKYYCKKVNVNQQDHCGRTALMFAAKYSGNNKIVKLLFKYCAANYLTDADDLTAVDYAKTKSLKRCIKNNGKGAVKSFFI